MGHGAFVWIRTVSGSTISTWPSGAKGVAPRSFSLGSPSRSRLNFTASASTGSPVWNFTPGRSLNSQVVGATSFGSSAASAGCSTRLPSRSSKVSNMLRARLPAGVSAWFIGSSVVGSTPWAIVTMAGDAARTPTGIASATERSARTRSAMGVGTRMTPPGEREIDRSSAMLGGGLGGVKAGTVPREKSQGLLARRHQPQGLRLTRAGEEPANRGPRREPERGHDVRAADERRRRGERPLLGGAPLQLPGAPPRRAAGPHPAVAAPDLQRIAAAQAGGVREREQQQLPRVLAEVAEE